MLPTMANFVCLLVLVFISYVSASCPMGSHYDSSYDKCYKYVATPTDFLSAELNCRYSGGSLVTIKNAYENSYIAAITSCSTTNSFWIGANFLMSAHMRWTSGYNGTYLNFVGEQSSDTCTSGCVALRESDGKWTKELCSNQKPYMCETEPTAGTLWNNSTTPSSEKTTTQLPMTTADPRRCETGYTLHPVSGKCYKLYAKFITYLHSSASPTCQAENATMAVIRSKEENDFLTSMTQKLVGPEIPIFHPWIGIVCNSSALSSCAWVDRSPLGYTNFAPGNPRDNMPAVYLEEKDGLWYSWRPEYSGGFFCEKPSFTV